jgi:DNA primase
MTSILERLVAEDFGIEDNGPNWARASMHNSLVIDKLNQVFYWNSQGIQGNAYVYLTSVRNLSYEDAKEYLKFAGGTETFIHEIKNGSETVVYPKLVDAFHQNLLYKNDFSYFEKRKISRETISRYKLGAYEDFVTIPFYMDGVFKNFQLRKDNPKVIRNFYRNVGPLLFNSDILKITNKIAIVEAPTSALVLNQNGIPTVSMNTGSEGFMEIWAGYFAHQKEIFILFDNDSAGKLGAIRAAKILGQTKCKLYNFDEYETPGYDAGNFYEDGGTTDKLMEILENKSRYCFQMPEFNTIERNTKWKKKTYKKS